MYKKIFNGRSPTTSVDVKLIDQTFGPGRERCVRDDDFSGYVLLALGINRLFNSLSAQTFRYLPAPEATTPTDPDDENAFRFRTSAGMFMTTHRAGAAPGKMGLAFLLRNSVPDRSATHYKAHMLLGLDGHLIAAAADSPKTYEVRRIIMPVFDAKGWIVAQRDMPPHAARQVLEYAAMCLDQMTEHRPLTPAHNQRDAGIFMTRRKEPGWNP